MSQSVLSIGDNTFQKEVLESPLPVLVDFWAEWCGPCRMLAPVLETLSQEMKDLLRVVKLNIEENPETPTTFQVRSIPTLILFKEGRAVATRAGFATQETLKSWILESLG